MTDEKKPPQGADDVAAELAVELLAIQPSAEVLALVRQIAADVAAMRESQAAATKEVVRLLARVLPDGDPVMTREA